jgi:hypothetical protein
VRGSEIRVFVAFWDAQRVGRVGFVDVAANDPRRVLRVSAQPVLDVGAPGTFDDNGVTPMCAVPVHNELHLYYAGWQLGVRSRYSLFTGLAVSVDGERFERVSQVPILDRCDGELFVRTAASVRRDAGRWQMWYAAGDRWITAGGKQVPSYQLRYLESPDGVTWGRPGRVCLDFASADEYGFGRVCVVERGGRYGMWYSVRSHSHGYRLGYADSADGVAWTRRDGHAGLDVSPAGWDSEMVCFASVIETERETYLFYNGNNFGETGFGVAVREG